MEIIKYPGREEWSSLIKRPALDVTTLFDTVRTVLDEVREQGDTAVKAYEEKFDKVLLSSLQVSEEEMREADALVAEDLKQAILRERMIEMNWEGTRYFDTRRHLIAETEDNGPFYGMNVNGDSKTTFYKRTVFENRVFKKAFYLYPIPQSEIDVNEKLVQNPYWK